MESYDTARAASMASGAATVINVVRLARAEQLVFGDKWHGFCVPILCYAPPCPCMGGPIIWVRELDILSEEKTGEKTSEGEDVVGLTVRKGARTRFEMQVQLRPSTVKAIQSAKLNRPNGCNGPGVLIKGVSLVDLIGGVNKGAKYAFSAGFALGTWADDQLDGGLSDEAADYIEGVVDFFKDLWD